MSAIRVEAKKATHTGGTKFYHLVRIVNLVGRKSFALRHYGKVEMFTGLGKLALGTMEEETGIVTGPSAGDAKWLEKVKKGYTDETLGDSWTFDSVDEAMKFLDGRFNAKAMGIVKTHVRKEEFLTGLANGANPGGASSVSATSFTRETDEPDHLKHAEWGSW